MTAPAASHWGMIGATPAVAALERMLTNDRVPHALLLVGPPQVGKGRLALALAQALNCDAPAPPCGECRSCRRIAEGKHADVEIISPGALCRVAEHDHSRSRRIGICAVRRVEMVASTTPFEGRQRVFIINPADALTGDAEDAFLKTLEEPPAAVTLVLVTSRPLALRETIRSRCRTITLAPLPTAVLADWLRAERGLEEATAQTVARLARGRADWAIEALREADPLALRQAAVEEIRRLSQARRAERLAFAESLGGRSGGEVANALVALESWASWWRDLLLVSANCADQIAHQDLRTLVEQESGRYRPREIVRFLLALQEAQAHLRAGVNARLCLDALFLQAPRPHTPEAPVAANGG